MSAFYIGLGYQKGQGKDTFADYLSDALEDKGVYTEVRSFAAPLYNLCHKVYGWAGFKTQAYYRDYPNEKNTVLKTGLTVRQTLINVGEHMRAYDASIWINHAFAAPRSQVVIITDVRLNNEIDAFKEKRHLLGKVKRTTSVEYASANDIDQMLEGRDCWDLIINNTGTLGQFADLAHSFGGIIAECLREGCDKTTMIGRLNDLRY